MTQPSNLLYFTGNYESFCKTIHSSGHLCVVDFFGVWCSPCRRFLEVLPDLANQNPDVTIIKVDIDKNEELARKYNIQSVPTIKFFKSTKENSITELTTVVGANLEAIKNKIAELK